MLTLRRMLLMHPLHHNRTLNRLLPLMQHQRILRTRPHLRPRPINHLSLVRVYSLSLGFTPIHNPLNDIKQLPSISDTMIKSLPPLISHRMRRIACQRDESAMVVPFVGGLGGIPIRKPKIPNRHIIRQPLISALPRVREPIILRNSPRLIQSLPIGPPGRPILLFQRRFPRDVEEEDPGLGPGRVGRVVHAEEGEVACGMDGADVEGVELPEVQCLLARVSVLDEGCADGEASWGSGFGACSDYVSSRSGASAIGTDEDSTSGRGAVLEVCGYQFAVGGVGDGREALVKFDIDSFAQEIAQLRAA